MEEILFFVILVAVVVLTQAIVFRIIKNTNQIILALLPNIGLLGIGILFSLVGYVVAMGEPGSWAGLGFIILLMVSLITTGISTMISLMVIFLFKSTTKN
jgi:hypothetical protein